MKRRLQWAVLGIAACAAVILVTMLLTTSGPEPVSAAKIVVPEGQDSELEVPKPPLPSSVTVLPPVGTPDAPPPTTTSPRQTAPPPPPPRPEAPKAPARPPGVDFQAENARISNGSIESNHAGFTGSGFVDYDNEVGSSVEWSVTAREATKADVTIRYANGSDETRPMDITVNGIQVAFGTFAPTNGWEDWRTITISVNLLAGTSRIKATATTDRGGPNVDKITVV